MSSFIYANPKLCIGCNACMAACTEAHKAEGLESQPRISIVRNEETCTPVACRHCENAPCAKVCPVNAITIGESAVLLNEAICIGCKLCAFACPFGVITFSSAGTKGSASKQSQKVNQEGLERDSSASVAMPAAAKDVRKVAVKCDLCSSLANGPECVRACADGALFLVDEKALKRSSSAKRKAAAISMPSMGNPKN
jgi:hydrogenase-4 component A